MILTTGKSQGFVLDGASRPSLLAERLPGASYRRSEGVIRMPENLASWRALRSLIERGDVETVTVSAKIALRRLRLAWREHRRRVNNATRRFKLSGETDIPVPLKTVPMEHQTRAFGFCSMLDESALFMDMGTGKTMVAIALAIHRSGQQEKAFRVLVICPKAVKPVWPREFDKHSGAHHSIGIDCEPVVVPGHIQVWVTNYDRVKREQRRLQKWKPDMIILDESHRIKNRKAARTKAVMALRSRFRLALSGSPFAKCISEVWSQVNFLKKDIFGSYSDFKDRYLRMGGYMNYKVVGYLNEDEFADKLHSIAFRVTKDECLDLPPLTYQRMYIESTPEVKRIYQAMDLNYFFEQDGEEVSVDREATKQMKLRQIVGGVVKSDGDALVKVSDLKANALEEFLEDREGKKTVLYFSFTHEIEIAKRICKKLGLGFLILQGSTPEKDRNVFEDRFQEDPSINVALIQIATGAEGMTLTAADVVGFYSPTFSYIGYCQGRDRINRKGQENPMTIIFFIMTGTVDERVVDVLESNRQLTDTFMESKRNYTMAKKTPAAETKTPVAKAEKTGYTATHMAESLGVSPADLRKHLRATGAEKPAGGWTWDSEKAAAPVLKQVQARIKELAETPKEPKAPAKKSAEKPAAEPKTPAKKPASKKPAAK